MSAVSVPRPRPALPFVLVALALAGNASAAAAPAGPPGAARAPAVTRERMEAGLAGAAPFRFVYGTLDPAHTALLRERALLAATRLYGADSSRVLADTAATAADLSTSGTVLLGSPRENAWTRRLAPELPVRFTDAGFRWRGSAYERPGDAIVLAWPNPLAPARFLVVAAGNSPAASAALRAWLPAGADWRITRGGVLAREGRFAQSAAAPWRYDPSLDRDREAERGRFAAALVPLGGAPLAVRAPPAHAGAAPARAAGVALLARLDALGLGARARAAPETLVLYRSLEQKGFVTRDTRPEHVAGGAAHAALPAGREAHDLWSVAAARLVSLGAAPASRFLEPAGVWLAGRFEGEPLERAVARLYDGRLLPTVADAATRGGELRSPLVRVPAQALLARALFERARDPRAALLALLSARAPGTLDSLCRAARADPGAVASRYRRLADSLAREGRGALALVRPRPWRPADGFQRGVCLAHTVSLEHGYLSGECASALRVLREAGAAWVSLSPFGYLPEPGVPVVLSSARGGVDEETDEAVAEAAARARALGLRTWLAPRLWARGPASDLSFPAGDWPRFFARYREFLLHWALLAERERIDGLVVGHELASSTALHPDRWRALIADVRAVYTGTLTYAATPAEAARVPFWDALDLVGVTFGAPLAAAPTRDPAVLRAGAGRLLAGLAPVAKRFGRPLLVAGAGYPALAHAAVRPRETAGGAPDPEAQRACYEAVVEALDGPDWVAGMLWSSWPSGGAGEDAAGAALSPRGRPAEAVVRAAFARWVERPVRVPR